MKYRGVEYYVAQGVEVGTWKFSTSLNDKIRTVRAKSRQDAAKVVERRIEEALAPKKRRLAPPASKQEVDYPRQKREGSRRAARTRLRWVKG